MHKSHFLISLMNETVSLSFISSGVLAALSHKTETQTLSHTTLLVHQ